MALYIEGKKLGFALETNTHSASSISGQESGQNSAFQFGRARGKTRSHYLLVKGSEIDVRIEIISVLLYNNTIQPTRTTDHGEATMNFQPKRFLPMMILSGMIKIIDK